MNAERQLSSMEDAGAGGIIEAVSAYIKTYAIAISTHSCFPFDSSVGLSRSKG